MDSKDNLIMVEGDIRLINGKKGTIIAVRADFRLDDDMWCEFLKSYLALFRKQSESDDVIILDLARIDDVKKISITGVDMMIGLSREYPMWYLFSEEMARKAGNLIRPSLLKVSTDKDEVRKVIFASA